MAEEKDYNAIQAELLANLPLKRQEMIDFCKRWNKPVPAWLITGGLGKRNPDINPLADPLPPLWRGQTQFRFLCMRGASTVTVLPLDDDGRCGEQEHISRDWHRYHTFGPYAEARPELLALRCPNSLSADEWQRVFASPSEARDWAKKAKVVKKQRSEEDYS